MSPEQAGAIDFTDVVALLEYWLDYPPVHLLLRGLAGYKGKSNEPANWRERRAREVGDTNYKPEKQAEAMSEKESRIVNDVLTGARHLDCAPPHIQQAIERFKKGEHLSVPKSE